TIALRTKFSATDNFRQLLDLIKNDMLHAYEHQAYPFDRLVEELDLKRNASRSPVFDIMIIFQNQQAGDTVEKHHVVKLNDGFLKEIFVQYDIVFDFWETPAGIDMKVEFNTSLYDEATITRL